jgi:lysozyme family protein
MADFVTAYKTYIQPAEGGYVNDPADKGGETYGGIARNIFPTWAGWSVIDAMKKTSGTIKRYTMIPQLDKAVQDFYQLNLWNKNNFGLISSQDVANILFDWFVNSGSNAFNTKSTETFGVQEILNRDFKKGISTDGAMGPQTVNAINSVDAAKLYDIIKTERKRFYDTIVAKNPSQEVFYKGWLNRLKLFPESITPVSAGLGLLGIFIVGGLLYLMFKGNTVSA